MALVLPHVPICVSQEKWASEGVVCEGVAQWRGFKAPNGGLRNSLGRFVLSRLARLPIGY